ncbi:DUF3592 domain-containing protein [Actinomadura sp. KC216]|uniref:DUF3592 domain-containing protein n=1 Tax=Actinomadura sp. KC216 TaxID=2530370 RepID=UPI001052982E|nr:DUF3592 domain-containing protein [Actinomadura sp. KC216]TDB86918.1 DUF3592 domain-containing protein [Actinomadura sp. KC216]
MATALFGLLIAVAIAAFAYGRLRATRARLRGLLTAKGQVVGHRRHQRGTGPAPTRHAPVVEFAGADGRPVRGESATFTKSLGPEVGTAVTVLYDPSDPTRIHVAGRDTGETEKRFFGASVVLAGIATTGLVATLLTS